MKMGGFTTVTMGLTSLLVSMLLLADPSEEQVAWRPQGRFGKRNHIDPRLQEDILSNTLRAIHEKEIADTKNMKLLSVSHFERDGLMCIASDAEFQRGLYRCFTVNPDVNSQHPLSLLTAPIVEIADILCVSAGDIGSYRCLQFIDETALPDN